MIDEAFYVTLKEVQPEAGWQFGGGVQVLVDTSAYAHDGREQPEWCEFERVAPGTASVYPVKAKIPGLGSGQWKFEEVVKWRMTTTLYGALCEMAERFDGSVPEWLQHALVAADRQR